ncbi:MAG TPA: DUF4352 domain-containing protein [Candidatus Nanopelagicaceae bacterium]
MKISRPIVLISMILGLVPFQLNVANAAPKISGVIGSVVADGDMAVQVKALKCGVKTIGSGFEQETALGQFCIVTFALSAAKKKPVNYFSDSQKGLTKAGFTVAPKSMLSDEFPMTLDLNPGNAVLIKIAYDVGKKDPLKAIEFHDSMFSGGVVVDLTKTLSKKK